jgi:hypothetical protein
MSEGLGGAKSVTLSVTTDPIAPVPDDHDVGVALASAPMVHEGASDTSSSSVSNAPNTVFGVRDRELEMSRESYGSRSEFSDRSHEWSSVSPESSSVEEGSADTSVDLSVEQGQLDFRVTPKMICKDDVWEKAQRDGTYRSMFGAVSPAMVSAFAGEFEFFGVRANGRCLTMSLIAAWCVNTGAPLCLDGVSVETRREDAVQAMIDLVLRRKHKMAPEMWVSVDETIGQLRAGTIVECAEILIASMVSVGQMNICVLEDPLREEAYDESGKVSAYMWQAVVKVRVAYLVHCSRNGGELDHYQLMVPREWLEDPLPLGSMGTSWRENLRAFLGSDEKIAGRSANVEGDEALARKLQAGESVSSDEFVQEEQAEELPLSGDAASASQPGASENPIDVGSSTLMSPNSEQGASAAAPIEVESSPSMSPNSKLARAEKGVGQSASGVMTLRTRKILLETRRQDEVTVEESDASDDLIPSSDGFELLGQANQSSPESPLDSETGVVTDESVQAPQLETQAPQQREGCAEFLGLPPHQPVII